MTEVPKTNMISVVHTVDNGLITFFPIQVKPLELGKSHKFPSNRRIANISELRNSIDTWFPENPREMPVFLARNKLN
jgi:hypothetical protein